MILSPYRNPPYRSPTPRKANHQPQATSQQPQQQEQQHISPNKRKRSDSTPAEVPATPSPSSSPSSSPPSLLEIETVARVHQENELEERPLSPRSGVAEKLQSLRLVREESPKKKARVGVSSSRCGEMVTGHVAEQEGFRSVEVVEGCTPQPQRTFSPTSPKVVVHKTEAETAMAIDTPSTPLPTTDDPDPSALTWQDEEITGHEIDVAGDDDGEGINGIGFKPTSAMAYARSQKRKQQVNEWRVREAREARQRRLEKRRGGSVVEGKERVVRFAGVS